MNITNTAALPIAHVLADYLTVGDVVAGDLMNMRVLEKRRTVDGIFVVLEYGAYRMGWIYSPDDVVTVRAATDRR